MIPILILHHNEFKYLKYCINSLEKNTQYPHEIMIIDNNSNREVKEKIKVTFSKKYKIFFNKKDNWLLGFNLAIKSIKWNWHYIVLTDADICFKKTKNKKCWLKYLVNQMNKNLCMGKLGIKLNTHYISKKKYFREIFKRELSYQEGKKIGDNIIAPVDTTAAIYRKNIFIHDKFEMKIGHTSLIKPYYYSCRTGKDLDCIHFGWQKYFKTYKTKKNYKHLAEKAYFFAKWNRPIEKTLSIELTVYDRIYTYLLSRIMRLFFSVNFIYLWIIYLIKNFPFNYNEIQNKYNK